MEATSNRQETGRIVLVVGADSSERTDAARSLIDKGQSVVLCAGPPACPLLRDEPCALVSVADAVVFMPAAKTSSRAVLSGLARCARSAVCPVVIEDSSNVAWPAYAVHVAPDDLEGVALGVAGASV